MSDFDLPAGFKPPVPPAFATYCHSRSPRWKFHTSIAHAKNAIIAAYGYRGLPNFLLMELVNGVWQVKYEVEPTTRRVDMPWNLPEVQRAATPRADKIERLQGEIARLTEELDAANTELREILG